MSIDYLKTLTHTTQMYILIIILLMSPLFLILNANLIIDVLYIILSYFHILLIIRYQSVIHQSYLLQNSEFPSFEK